jgi:hypothetical protein
MCVGVDVGKCTIRFYSMHVCMSFVCALVRVHAFVHVLCAAFFYVCACVICSFVDAS